MTAQEIYEREGFLPLSTSIKMSIGDVVKLTARLSGVFLEADCSAVIIGTLSQRQFRALERKYHPYAPHARFSTGPHFYKLRAE